MPDLLHRAVHLEQLVLTDIHEGLPPKGFGGGKAALSPRKLFPTAETVKLGGLFNIRASATSMEIPPQEDRSMAKHGHLNLGNAGYSMPADAAAYQRPPFYYRNTRSISVAFETNLEAALEALPEPLALSDPATAILSFYEYPWTTFGPYNEAILSLLVEHKGRPMNYIMHIAVTTEPPMLAGREIWGFPKKLAQIEFKSERDMIYGTLERPAGIRLASAIVRPERPAGN